MSADLAVKLNVVALWMAFAVVCAIVIGAF